MGWWPGRTRRVCSPAAPQRTISVPGHPLSIHVCHLMLKASPQAHHPQQSPPLPARDISPGRAVRTPRPRPRIRLARPARHRSALASRSLRAQRRKRQPRRPPGNLRQRAIPKLRRLPTSGRRCGHANHKRHWWVELLPSWPSEIRRHVQQLGA